MLLAKIQDLLADVERQRLDLEVFEVQLRTMIAKLSGAQAIPFISPASLQESAVANAPTPIVSQRRNVERDKFDDMVDVLRAAGKPLHITQIAEGVSAMTGEKVVRTKIEPGINRHIAKVKRRRIEKFGPSIYGLPEWKDRNASIVQ